MALLSLALIWDDMFLIRVMKCLSASSHSIFEQWPRGELLMGWWACSLHFTRLISYFYFCFPIFRDIRNMLVALMFHKMWWNSSQELKKFVAPHTRRKHRSGFSSSVKTKEASKVGCKWESLHPQWKRIPSTSTQRAVKLWDSTRLKRKT